MRVLAVVALAVSVGCSPSLNSPSAAGSSLTVVTFRQIEPGQLIAHVARDGTGVPDQAVLFIAATHVRIPTSVVTNGHGDAAVSYQSAVRARVTALVDSVSVSILAEATPIIELPPPEAPEPAPPLPPPTPTPVPFYVVVSCVPAPAGSATPCNVTAFLAQMPLPSAMITSVVWDCGDGVTVSVANSPLVSHVYAQSGSFVGAATVTAMTADGVRTATTFYSVTIPS
jgi:hypothetical protein